MKTTKLPSVEEEVEKYEEEAGNFSSVALIINSVRANAILTRRDNQAYTRLMEGIEGMKTDERKVATFGEWQAESYEDKMLVNAILTDILENVVKPLYGKK